MPEPEDEEIEQAGRITRSFLAGIASRNGRAKPLDVIEEIIKTGEAREPVAMIMRGELLKVVPTLIKLDVVRMSGPYMVVGPEGWTLIALALLADRGDMAATTCLVCGSQLPKETDPRDLCPQPRPRRTVVAAAVLLDGVIHTLPPPARHHTIRDYMIDKGFSYKRGEQGFLLSDGKFARRPAAAYVAFMAGQVSTVPNPFTSEDLW